MSKLVQRGNGDKKKRPPKRPLGEIRDGEGYLFLCFLSRVTAPRASNDKLAGSGVATTAFS
jgi:hypothetical protein